MKCSMLINTFLVINQIWDIFWCCVPFCNIFFHRIHGQQFFVHPYSTKIIFCFLFTGYIIFNGSLKPIYNRRNTCLNFINNTLFIPKIFPKDIQIFHYFLHMMDFGHVRELLKENRSGCYHMACYDINHKQYIFEPDITLFWWIYLI